MTGVLNRLFKWRLGGNAGSTGGVPERAKVYVRANGARYVKADEVLASKRGQELIAELRRGLEKPRQAGDTRKRLSLGGHREDTVTE